MSKSTIFLTRSTIALALALAENLKSGSPVLGGVHEVRLTERVSERELERRQASNGRGEPGRLSNTSIRAPVLKGRSGVVRKSAECRVVELQVVEVSAANIDIGIAHVMRNHRVKRAIFRNVFLGAKTVVATARARFAQQAVQQEELTKRWLRLTTVDIWHVDVDYLNGMHVA